MAQTDIGQKFKNNTSGSEAQTKLTHAKHEIARKLTEKQADIERLEALHDQDQDALEALQAKLEKMRLQDEMKVEDQESAVQCVKVCPHKQLCATLVILLPCRAVCM